MVGGCEDEGHVVSGAFGPDGYIPLKWFDKVGLY